MMMMLWAALLAAGQAHGPVAHVTDVRAGFSDDLTQQFADAMTKALAKAKYMKPESGDDADDLYLSVLFPLTEDGKRFDYAVDLMKVEPLTSPDRLASFTGRCRTAEIEACAQDVVAKADKKAGES